VADLLRRTPAQDPGAVDLAFVWIGVNDAVAGAWDADGDSAAWSWESRLGRLAADYARLLTWTAARAPRIVCVRPVVLEAEGSVWTARADQIGDTVEECTRTVPGAWPLDLRPVFAAAAADGRGPFTVDGVHFTDAGAVVVAAAFAEAIAAAGG
jgi:lysophospholipase L1-like esterase